SDFATYPPAATEGPNIVCKACGLSFSVFRKKHVCCDCKKDFCSFCSVSQENLRRCSTCHLLQETAFQRPQLMRLKVKDLRQYLLLRNIPTDTCREKEDLVDLVLCHRGLGSGDDLDSSSLNSSRSETSSFFTQSFFSNYTAPSATVSSFQGELMDRDGTFRSEVLAQGSLVLDGERMQLQDEEDDSLCRICMDAVIDCVLLECGHMVTCTKCGKRMSECPICRQYVVRAVHVF
ncbi:hypothetical protein A6R68_18512, partial [Neotoma lepida]